MSKHIALIQNPGTNVQLHKDIWDLVGGTKREWLFQRTGSTVFVSSSVPFPGSVEAQDTYAPGTKLAYQVKVDAVRRHKGKNRNSVKDHELSQWFEERFEGNGFEIAGVPRVTEIRDINFNKDDGTPIHYHAVTFEGKLIVSDTELFRKLLHEGAKRGKSYGLGLFLVKPIQSSTATNNNAKQGVSND